MNDGPPSPAAAGTLSVVPVDPLTAAHCAERAAACITLAETPGSTPAVIGGLLAVAQAWRELGCSMATNSAMNRPRDDPGARR